jgi:hypothetical protein
MLAEACLRVLAAADRLSSAQRFLKNLPQLLKRDSSVAFYLLNLPVFEADCAFGSQEHQQLYALLVTLLKCCARMQQGGFDQDAATLQQHVMQVAQQAMVLAIADAAGSGPFDNSQLLPWAWLVGRCVLQDPLKLLVPQAGQQQQQQRAPAGMSAAEVQQVVLDVTDTSSSCLTVCMGWLQRPVTQAHLSRRGYQPKACCSPCNQQPQDWRWRGSATACQQLVVQQCSAVRV